MDKKRRTNIILVVGIISCYIIYSIFWMRAATIQTNLDNNVLSEEITQFEKESIIRNVSELFTYILFLVFCWNAWDDTISKKYLVYFRKAGSVILGSIVLGGFFSAVQYLILGMSSNNYMISIVILIGVMLVVLMLVSGKQAKLDIRNKNK